MFDIQENLKKLPDKPGVYLHKDKLGQVIYVGKAISLKNRVRQYFRSPKHMDPKVRAMVSHIEEFEYIITTTEMEALILECNLIKKYMPQYNVLLRDDKTFPYIKLTTNEKWPRLLKTRKVYHDGCKYFGPYTDVGAVNQIIDLLNQVYSLKKCSVVKFPQGFKPCLNYHINQCAGICTGKADEGEYHASVEQIAEFLNGKNKRILEYLDDKMNKSAETLDFEKAAEYRDYISAVHAITEKQRVVLMNAGDMDMILAAKGKQDAHAIMFFIRQGRLSGRESYHIQAGSEYEETDVVSAFIQQYYTENSMIPKEILVETELEEMELLEAWLSKLRGSLVKISVPKKGDKRALMELAKKDVVEMSKTLDEKAEHQREREHAVGAALRKFIGDRLQKAENQEEDGAADVGTPYIGQRYRIEAYDISNTNGVDSVGAMVVFEGSKPRRKDYRRFKIKTIEGPDDYGSLQEVLYRRFKRGLSGDDSFSVMPDLILMDGGRAQVSVAIQVLNAMGVSIPVAGMAKDDKHRTKSLIFEDRELELKTEPVLYKYIASIQEEVHRFAIDYHHGLRNKNLQKSQLDNIEGIGQTRRNSLLKHFGSIDAIKAADADTLSEAPSMNRQTAEKVWEYFH